MNENLWQQTMTRVFKYLNTYPTTVNTDMKKTYPRPYSEIVENYDELKYLFDQINT